MEQPFWNEFKVFKDLNLSYKNSSSKKKIEKETQKIKAIIQKFVENLINKTQKLSEIPKSIQQIIYHFIKERAYFPREFFTTYQIYRLDFHKNKAELVKKMIDCSKIQKIDIFFN